MSSAGSFRLKGVKYKQAEGGGDQRYVVSFTTWGSGGSTAEVAIAIPLAEGVPETDVIREAGARCHRFLTHLAEETKGWDSKPA